MRYIDMRVSHVVVNVDEGESTPLLGGESPVKKWIDAKVASGAISAEFAQKLTTYHQGNRDVRVADLVGSYLTSQYNELHYSWDEFFQPIDANCEEVSFSYCPVELADPDARTSRTYDKLYLLEIFGSEEYLVSPDWERGDFLRKKGIDPIYVRKSDYSLFTVNDIAKLSISEELFFRFLNMLSELGICKPFEVIYEPILKETKESKESAWDLLVKHRVTIPHSVLTILMLTIVFAYGAETTCVVEDLMPTALAELQKIGTCYGPGASPWILDNCGTDSAAVCTNDPDEDPIAWSALNENSAIYAYIGLLVSNFVALCEIDEYPLISSVFLLLSFSIAMFLSVFSIIPGLIIAKSSDNGMHVICATIADFLEHTQNYTAISEGEFRGEVTKASLPCSKGLSTITQPGLIVSSFILYHAYIGLFLYVHRKALMGTLAGDTPSKKPLKELKSGCLQEVGKVCRKYAAREANQADRVNQASMWSYLPSVSDLRRSFRANVTAMFFNPAYEEGKPQDGDEPQDDDKPQDNNGYNGISHHS